MNREEERKCSVKKSGKIGGRRQEDLCSHGITQADASEVRKLFWVNAEVELSVKMRFMYKTFILLTITDSRTE